MSVDESSPSWVTLPGSSASTPYPIARQATQIAPRRPSGKRITEEGYRLVDELYKVNPYPSQSQKKETLQKIVALPGCEHYRYDNLNQRLALHRKRDGVSQGGVAKAGRPSTLTRNTHIAFNPSTVEDILYPSLMQRSGIISALQILVKEYPRATRSQVDIWAKRLGVHADDIETWIAHQQDKLQQEPSKPVINSQLPTPGSSCSPEPLSPVQTTATHSAPAVPKLEYADQTESKPRPTFFLSEQFHDLADKIHVARTGAGTPPLSTEQATKVLDEHTERMKAFLERYEKGEYAAIGLSPHLLGEADTSMPLKLEV